MGSTDNTRKRDPVRIRTKRDQQCRYPHTLQTTHLRTLEAMTAQLYISRASGPGASVSADQWDSRPDGRFDGDTLRVSDTGMVYVWSEALGHWVVPDVRGWASTSVLATVAGDNADLTTEGWTHTSSAGTTTTDGTRVTVGISGAVTEQWSATTPPASGAKLGFSGYVGFSDPVAAQTQIQLISGTPYGLFSRSSAVLAAAYDWHVRLSSSAALRPTEYASALQDDTERWVDITYDPDARGQYRVWVDHQPWFGCGSVALQSGGALQVVSLLATTAGVGSNAAEMTLRQVHVIEGS